MHDRPPSCLRNTRRHPQLPALGSRSQRQKGWRRPCRWRPRLRKRCRPCVAAAAGRRAFGAPRADAPAPERTTPLAQPQTRRGERVGEHGSRRGSPLSLGCLLPDASCLFPQSGAPRSHGPVAPESPRPRRGTTRSPRPAAGRVRDDVRWLGGRAVGGRAGADPCPAPRLESSRSPRRPSPGAALASRHRSRAANPPEARPAAPPTPANFDKHRGGGGRRPPGSETPPADGGGWPPPAPTSR